MRTIVIATAFLCNRHRSRRHRHVGRLRLRLESRLPRRLSARSSDSLHRRDYVPSRLLVRLHLEGREGPVIPGPVFFAEMHE